MRVEISNTVQVVALGINWGNFSEGNYIEDRISLILGFMIVSFYFNHRIEKNE
jgi:hypothetical protein